LDASGSQLLLAGTVAGKDESFMAPLALIANIFLIVNVNVNSSAETHNEK
jgi:hypothetical protein